MWNVPNLSAIDVNAEEESLNKTQWAEIQYSLTSIYPFNAAEFQSS